MSEPIELRPESEQQYLKSLLQRQYRTLPGAPPSETDDDGLSAYQRWYRAQTEAMNRAAKLNRPLEYEEPLVRKLPDELWQYLTNISHNGHNQTPENTAHVCERTLANSDFDPSALGNVPGVNPRRDRIQALEEALEKAKIDAEIAAQSAKLALGLLQGLT